MPGPRCRARGFLRFPLSPARPRRPSFPSRRRGLALAFVAGVFLLLAGTSTVVALQDAAQAFVVGKLSLHAGADAIVVPVDLDVP